MKIKICGMKIPENILAVAQLQPDYLGFIFYRKSPRYFESKIPDLPVSIKKVGVFVDATEAEIIDRVNQHQLDVVQLHGAEQPEACEQLRAKGMEVIKVFSVGDTFDFKELHPYEEVVDYFLFDTRGKAPGGNGISFNWDVLTAYSSRVPFFLSGGIGLAEVAAIKELHKEFQAAGKAPLLAGIDLNSRFETSPGIKKQQELNDFLQLLKQAVREPKVGKH